MSKYTIKVISELHLNDEDLDSYIEDRKIEWGKERPDEIRSLIENGNCLLKDNTGTTQIIVEKVS